MYIDFFNLKHRPFAITPDMDFMYWSDSHRRAYDTLQQEVFRGAPVTMLTGQVGTGKTLLINALINDTEIAEKFHVLLLSNMFGDASEVLQRLLLALDKKTKDAAAMFDEVSLGLQEIRASELSPLIIADEAQTLSPAGAEVLGKIAGNDAHGKTSIVISGQTELDGIIERAGYRNLHRQIGESVRLSELQLEDTLSYITTRLEKAGAKREIFSVEAAGLIHAKAKGIPRLINKLCEALLFLAAQEGAKAIDASTAKRFLYKNIDPTTLALQSVGDAPGTATGDEFVFVRTDDNPTTIIEEIAELSPPAPAPAPSLAAAPPVSPASVANTTKASQGVKWVWVGMAASLAALALPLHPTIHEYLDRSLYGKFGTGTLKTEIAELTAEKQAIEQELLVAEDKLMQVRETERLLAAQAQTALEQIVDLQQKVAEEEELLATLREGTEKAALLTMEEIAVLGTVDEMVQVAHQDHEVRNGFAAEASLLLTETKDFSSFIKAVGQVPTTDAALFFSDAIDRVDRQKMAIGYARAALGGHRRAARYLGQLYETGDGVTFSPAVADRWYVLAEGQQPKPTAEEDPNSYAATGGRATPLFSSAEDQELDLVWDGDSTSFLIEFGDADGHVIGRFETPLTAARLTYPENAASWRVSADGGSTSSAWQTIAAQNE